MPHIHTEPGQIDFTADVFVVHKNKVLFRFHDKHKLWLVPGGHIELDETPDAGAVREVFEEVGLEIKLYQTKPLPTFEDSDERLVSGDYQELAVPQGMNIHSVSETHRHISLVYYASSSTDQIIEPEGKEKSGGCIWLNREELIARQDIHPSLKRYGVEALELLAE